MNHGRADYNSRIKDSAGIIPAGEPVFLIRGKDKASPGAARAYAELAKALGAPPNVIQRALDQADAMEAWQRTHEPRLAD